jgi:solute carrier family 50 protein (sugar transporter)
MQTKIITVNQLDLFSFFLKTAGPVFFMSMQLSYLQTASKILSKKSDCRLSILPFVSLVTNCAVWIMYATLKVNATIFIPNFTGFIAGLVCVFAFQVYTNEKNLLIFIAAGLILTITVFFFVQGSASIVGMIGVCLSVILMGAPLVALKIIIEEKSTATLPFMTSITTFLNGLCWTLYGFLEAHDPIVYVPNSIGLFLACIQLSLFVIYGFPPKVAAVEDYTEIKSSGTQDITIKLSSIADSNFKDESTASSNESNQFGTVISSLTHNDTKNLPNYV